MDELMSRLAAAAVKTAVVHPPRPKREPVVATPRPLHPNIHPAAPEVLISLQEPATLPSIAGNSHPASLPALHLPQ